MIPVLSLDYEKVNARVLEFKDRMDRAEAVAVHFLSGGLEHLANFDLRFRTGHERGGLMREEGIVGNLPSGESYIIPYDGEKANEPSRTSGVLPVQFDDESVLYRIESNHIAFGRSDHFGGATSPAPLRNRKNVLSTSTVCTCRVFSQ